MQTEKITALYARFSHDESSSGQDSNSITHQKELLAEYANTHGFINYRFYVDDGYSGVNFERPEFKRLIADMENGLIGTIIVKDMSRLGRNYLMVGQYTEIIFPENDVRFIAISDNVDSAEGLSDLIPFSNLINEWYAKDISKKMRAMMQQKGNSGKHLSSTPPYGYKKDPNDKEKWIIDEYAAEVVRQIYEMYISGKGMSKIADFLSDEKILRPYAYKYKIDGDSIYDWRDDTVRSILTNQAYCGDTVNFRFHRVSYKSSQIVKNPPELQKVFYDTHPAIIDRDTFEQVQQRFQKRLRRKKVKIDALFSGYIYCKDCKSRCHVFRRSTKKNIVAYECSSYRKRKRTCTYHQIDESVLQKYVLEQIQSLCDKIKGDLPSFKAKVQAKSASDKNVSRKRIQEELSAAQNRITEIDGYVQALFESKVRNEISTEVFGNLSKNYMDEKSKLNSRISDLILEESKLKEENSKINQLYLAAEKYDCITELTSDVLQDFVERIEIGERPKKSQKSQKQEIDLYFLGVGIVNDL